jgi:hypothetical protein
MNNTFRKISPFALGVALCCYQIVQQPMVQAASLSSDSVSDLTSLSPSVPVDAAAGSAVGSCPINSLKTPQQDGTLPGASSSLGYQSASIAESGVVPASKGASSMQVAQLVPDENCCEFGGTADCELGGVAPAGGAAAAGFPFAALAGLLPLAAIPFIAGDDGNGGDQTPPVPEPSSTAGIVAGFGMLGLWLSRRFRTGQNPSL